MYGNVRNAGNMQAMQGFVKDTVMQALNEFSSPQKVEKLIEADGGAYRAYNYNICLKRK